MTKPSNTQEILLRLNNGYMQIKANSDYDSGYNRIWFGSLNIDQNSGIELPSDSTYEVKQENGFDYISGKFTNLFYFYFILLA